MYSYNECIGSLVWFQNAGKGFIHGDSFDMLNTLPWLMLILTWLGSHMLHSFTFLESLWIEIMAWSFILFGFKYTFIVYEGLICICIYICISSIYTWLKNVKNVQKNVKWNKEI